jgi:2-polyprenyl-3-methyl-5-hydroxy-6-metoxy-1,4-benzoquinol methylase
MEVKNLDDKNILKNKKYLNFLYSEKRRPMSNYPAQLAKHLRDHYYQGIDSLIDIGCGRGDMLKALSGIGFDVSGADISPASIDKTDTLIAGVSL